MSEDEEDPLAGGLHKIERDPFYAKDVEVEVESALRAMQSDRVRLDLHLVKKVTAKTTPKGALEGEGGKDAVVERILATKVLRLDDSRLHRIENLEMFGGTLRELYLQHNSIQVVENLETLTGLRVLALHGNKIEKVQGVAGLSRLQYLNLAGNCIQEVDVQELPPSLEALDLSNNPLDSNAELMEDLELALPELLSLNNNRIKHRFEELFEIVGTSAADSLAAGGTGGIVEDVEQHDIPQSAVSSMAKGKSSALRVQLQNTLRQSSRQLESRAPAGSTFRSKRQEIFARMEQRKLDFATKQEERQRANIAKARDMRKQK